MADNLKKGHKVEWGTPQGKTTGTVKEKVTGEKRVANKGQKGTRVKASKDDPRYVVESEKSGKRAAHKGDALKKKSQTVADRPRPHAVAEFSASTASDGSFPAPAADPFLLPSSDAVDAGSALPRRRAPRSRCG